MAEIYSSDSPREECGIMGVFAPNEDVATMTYFGLFALQHRGQEAAGIAVSDGHNLRCHKDTGLVSQVFNPTNLASLSGKYAIGHTRYSTTGSSSVRNAQPFLVETRHGPIAIAHNGNLINAPELRDRLLSRGFGLVSSSDSEIITMMLAGAEGETWDKRIQAVMPEWKGAYSLVVLTRESVCAVRDPWGFRPLSVGLLPAGGHAVASESGALLTLGCLAIREVQPGEIVTLSANALLVRQAMPPASKQAHCTFEHIYFSRPDSFWDGRSVHTVRRRLGEELARESFVEAEMIMPVPDSAIPAAIGYSQVSRIAYNEGLVQNRYIGRTFIQPTDSLRKKGVTLKFNVLDENVRGKRLVVLDDSIVRGNTLGPLVHMLREAGAREVHLRITCPPIRHPCFMGVDMGTYEELIAHRMSVDEICAYIGCDSLHYLSMGGMMRAIGRDDGYCNACFTGEYPLPVESVHNKHSLEGGISD